MAPTVGFSLAKKFGEAAGFDLRLRLMNSIVHILND